MNKNALGHYILRGHKAVPCDLMTWARWFDTAGDSRVVARTTIGNADVSTVFLGLDHQWGKGPPLLFETMVFGGKLNGYTDRYTTWDEAEVGHAAVCAIVSASANRETEG